MLLAHFTIGVFLAAAKALPTDLFAPSDSCQLTTFLQRSSYTSYTALGDSYAAGLGSVQRLTICPTGQDPASSTCTSTGCGKDIGSYAYQFASKHATSLQYLACSGASSSDVTNNQVSSSYFGDPDLVTLQAGGDDNSAFASIILKCVISPSEDACVQVINATINGLNTIITSVNNTMTAVNNRVSSTTTKVLIGYVKFFGTSYDSDCAVVRANVPGDLRQKVNDLVVLANTGLSRVAASKGFLFFTPDSAFDGHRWCDTAEPWWIFNTLFENGTDPSGQPYRELVVGHPSDMGQKAYLGVLEALLKV